MLCNFYLTLLNAKNMSDSQLQNKIIFSENVSHVAVIILRTEALD